MADFNLGRAVADRLIGQHGFEETDRIGELRRIVDSQHALVFDDGHWHRGSKGGYKSVNARLYVARRDVNELRAHVYSDDWLTWGPTFDVTKAVGVSDGFIFGTEEDVDPWIESWLPRFVAEGPHLPLLRSVLEKESAYSKPRDGLRWVRWMSAMLDGWSDADEEEFLSSIESILAVREDVPEEQRNSAQGRVDRTRAWVGEHPNGIEREFSD